MLRYLSTCLFLALISGSCYAKIFVYVGPQGERMISDHPIQDDDYQLITEKSSLRHMGDMLANRRPMCAGTRHCFRESINSASQRFRVDPALIEAVIETESSFNPRAISKKGAAGLMQLMDSTADQYNVFDSLDPDANINAGVQHLSMLMNRFDRKLPLALAAYNAGASTVERYGGIPPYPETKRYVLKVLSSYNRIRGFAN